MAWMQSAWKPKQAQETLGYPADDEPLPIAAREKPQDMLCEVLHSLSDADLLIRFHAQRNSLAGHTALQGEGQVVN